MDPSNVSPNEIKATLVEACGTPYGFTVKHSLKMESSESACQSEEHNEIVHSLLPFCTECESPFYVVDPHCVYCLPHSHLVTALVVYIVIICSCNACFTLVAPKMGE